ncbi:hypothetical protein MEQU1_001504 [Malassezia equina]|uniref:F-box domain-containing protein n=1 Tax=Malassezia equina TaxID=1381935 RepID=A0AAF0EAJ9_9BASI|nr:hypothetical protein MEQU1_001504 [Malassezia equina]
MTRVEAAQLQQLTASLAASTRDTERARIYLKRALVYVHGDDVRHALRDVRDALRLASSHASILVRAARIFMEAQFPDKAHRVLHLAEQRSPSASEKTLITALRAKLARSLPTRVAALPVELLMHILGYLPTSSLYTCMLVCRSWRTWILQHRPLWHTIAVRAPTAPDAIAARAQYETAAKYLQRGVRHVRHLCLRAPLTDHRRVWSLVAPLRLTTLDISCEYAQASAWFAWACTHASLQSVTLRATPSKGMATHPWLGPPMHACRADARFQHVALHQTPPLAADTITLTACSQLQSLVYDAGESLHSLQEVRARCAVTLVTLWHHVQHTLTSLALRGAALWVGPDPLPLRPTTSLRALQRLCAPFACLGTDAELPDKLIEWETTLPTDPALAERAVALAERCAPTLHTCTFHVSHSAGTPLAERLLSTLTMLGTLQVVVDEAVAPPPLIESYDAARHSALTPATLLRLLTPGCWDARVLCPQLHTLRLVHDTTVRGRELIDLVRVRAARPVCL